MSSLVDHLDRHDLAVGGLGFRRDCPLCRAERLHGTLPSAALVPARACAALTALAVAAGGGAPAGGGAAGRPGGGVPAPASPPVPKVSDVAAADGGAAPV